jgi:hypothetical protein
MTLTIRKGWWRATLAVGATTALLPLSGCSAASTSAQSTSPPHASTRPSTCVGLPPSDVPALNGALTQADTGNYCAHPGTSVLVVLKAATPAPADRWSASGVAGPAGGATRVSAPLTALRGTTVAAYRFARPGSYQLTAVARGRSWHATITVR